MGRLRNALFATGATAVLVVGLLLLLPNAAAAIQPQAPIVQLTDRDSSTADTLRTTLTVPVVIPPGEFIPLGYAQVLRTTGAVTFDGSGHLTGAASCTATITQVSGASLAFGKFNGYGYTSFAAEGYGYGYVFGTTITGNILSGYNAGFDPGYGYGYGPAAGSTTSITVTVTVVADNCPNVAAFGGDTFKAFNFQVLVGANSGINFASLPATLILRNPEAPFPTVVPCPGVGCNTVAADATSFQLAVQDGGQQVTFGFFAQYGTLDGAQFLTGQSPVIPLPAGTFGVNAQIIMNQPLPEGANIQLTFQDQATTGSTFNLNSAPFNINPATLGTQSGGIPPAGFMSVRATNLQPGVTLTSYIDLKITLNVPQTYFTANGLAVNSFRLVRFADDGTLATGGSTCTFVGTSGSNYQFSCTLTDFSSFAMIASIAGGGGGGGGVVTTTTTTAGPGSTVTLTPTGTATTTAPGTGTTTSAPGTQQPPSTGPGSTVPPGTTTKKKGGIPGFEAVLLVAALGAALLVARRRLK